MDLTNPFEEQPVAHAGAANLHNSSATQHRVTGATPTKRPGIARLDDSHNSYFTASPHNSGSASGVGVVVMDGKDGTVASSGDNKNVPLKTSEWPYAPVHACVVADVSDVHGALEPLPPPLYAIADKRSSGLLMITRQLPKLHLQIDWDPHSSPR